MTSALLVEFLAWVAGRPRTYGETMEAWRTSCPRMPIWEDAIEGDLVEIVHAAGIGLQQSPVRLTAAGRTMLAAAAVPVPQ